MIFTILLGIALIVAIVVCIIRSDDIFDRILGPLGCTAIAFLLFLLCVIIPSACCIDAFSQDIYYEHTDTVPITAMQDALIGKFYIGSRNHDNSLHYYYCYESEYGYRINDISADETAILYTEEEPRLEVFKSVGFKNFWLNVFCIPMQTYYKAYIPEGSIATSFQIDMH